MGENNDYVYKEVLGMSDAAYSLLRIALSSVISESCLSNLGHQLATLIIDGRLGDCEGPEADPGLPGPHLD